MRVRNNSLACLVSVAALSCFPLVAGAIQVGSSTQTNDPGTPVWNYVGSIGGASGVFLGNYGGTGWVLTAAHVGSGSFTLGNTTYSPTGSSFTNFTYNSALADLTLFQINGTPNLANLGFAEPTNGSAVEMIGFGGGKSWGDNVIYGYTTYTLTDTPYGGPGVVTLASYNSGNGAQGVGGDSGGGEFFYFSNSNTWYLTGILSGVGTLTDSNNNSVGNGTIAVDVTLYTSQIAADITSVTAIPEPSEWAVIAGGAMLAVAALRRRKKPAAA